MGRKCHAVQSNFLLYHYFLLVITIAKNMTRRTGPLSGIMQVGNFVNLSIHLANVKNLYERLYGPYNFPNKFKSLPDESISLQGPSHAWCSKVVPSI